MLDVDGTPLIAVSLTGGASATSSCATGVAVREGVRCEASKSDTSFESGEM